MDNKKAALILTFLVIACFLVIYFLFAVNDLARMFGVF